MSRKRTRISHETPLRGGSCLGCVLLSVGGFVGMDGGKGL